MQAHYLKNTKFPLTGMVLFDADDDLIQVASAAGHQFFQ